MSFCVWHFPAYFPQRIAIKLKQASRTVPDLSVINIQFLLHLCKTTSRDHFLRGKRNRDTERSASGTQTKPLLIQAAESPLTRVGMDQFVPAKSLAINCAWCSAAPLSRKTKRQQKHAENVPDTGFCGSPEQLFCSLFLFSESSFEHCPSKGAQKHSGSPR